MLRKPWSDQENEQCRDQAGSGGAKLGAVILELPTLAPKTPDLAPMRGRAGNHILVLCASASTQDCPFEQRAKRPDGAQRGNAAGRAPSPGPCSAFMSARVRLVVELPVQSSSVRTAIKRGTRGRALLLASDSLIIEADLGH